MMARRLHAGASGVAPVSLGFRPRGSRLLLGALLFCGGTVAAQAVAEAPRKSWDFEGDTPGRIARGFSNEVGRWEVVDDGGRRVLAQRARNGDATFNVALADGTAYRDVDLVVRLRAVAGEVDQGGGLVWRARDARNYYVARYNPLEDNFRVYKVQDGVRTQFRSAKVPGDRDWHTLRVTMAGDTIACYLDGTRYLEAVDATFPGPGKVGLWTKADAQTYFDDLAATPLGK